MELSAIRLFSIFGLFFGFVGYLLNKLFIISLDFFRNITRKTIVFAAIGVPGGIFDSGGLRDQYKINGTVNIPTLV
ncbi:MAG TPA: hypothetical protein EYP36_11075 [Calditrichaeota bacterium]|nr:hypothetical protein [Calditrichota bacterium]